MTGKQYIVVYDVAGNRPSAVNVISQSFSNGVQAYWFSAVSKTSSETLAWNVTGLTAGRTYQVKAVEVGSAGATATASVAFQTLIPFEAWGPYLRKRRVLMGI
jgi:hypothetical protein